MTLRGRARTVLRHVAGVDEARPRWLAIGAAFAAVSAAVLAMAMPKGSLTTPGPLSASHTSAGLACKACHESTASARTPSAATSDKVRVGTEACLSCHGDHGLRGGHARAAASGRLTCATCHPPHGSEAVRFFGEGRAIHSTPAGETAVAAGPIAAKTTVPVLRAHTCAECHDPSRPTDPLRACIDASGASSPALLVRCFGEHDRARPQGRAACAAQHDDARFAAREAAVRVVAGTSLKTTGGAALGLGLVLALGPVALGLVAYGGARLAKRRRRSSSAGAGGASGGSLAGPLAPPAVRRLPVIDASRCLGCYACVDACAFDVLTVERYVAKVERPDACCGALSCEAACPNGSLVLREEGAESEPVDRPRLTPALESEVVRGVFFAGDVTGVPLIRNAVLHGRRAADAVLERTRARAKSRAGKAGYDADVVIIGAGPAGLAASLRAQELGLTYLTLEQHAIAASIKSFPRGKLVFDAPFELPLEGEIFGRECTKEELVAAWSRIVRSRKPNVLEEHRVVDIAREARDESGASGGREGDAPFVVTYARSDGSESALRAGAIIVAIGQRGTPRQLDATIEAGAEGLVADALFDARSFAGRRVVVVGLGDSAMEAVQALAHQPGTEITVVYRGKGFERGRARNIEEVKALVESGRVGLRFESRVAHVAIGKVTVERAAGTSIVCEEIEADAVLALIGGVAGTSLLERLGLVGGPR